MHIKCLFYGRYLLKVAIDIVILVAVIWKKSATLQLVKNKMKKSQTEIVKQVNPPHVLRFQDLLLHKPIHLAYTW